MWNRSCASWCASSSRTETEGPVAVRRRAVRVLLLDPRDRILLLQSFDPGNPARGRFWYTLGGGAEDGEPPETTARREVGEEVGIRQFELGPLVWRRRTVF